MKHIRSYSLLALLITAILLLSSCASSYKGNISYSYDEAKGEIEVSPSAPDGLPLGNKDVSSDASSESLTDQRKIIRNVSLTLQTLDFETGIAAIEAQASALGGYVESSSIYGNSLGHTGTSRSAEYRVRIPASALDHYVGALGDRFNVLRRSENASDISEHYYDMQARLNSLKIQEERLLEMLSKADQLEYLLQLEDKLSSIRYEIESYQSSLKRYDSLVEYATVTISLQEVVNYTVVTETPATFGEQISRAFASSWEMFAQGLRGFAIVLIYALPLILSAAVIVVIIVIIYRSHKRRKKAKETIPEKKD